MTHSMCSHQVEISIGSAQALHSISESITAHTQCLSLRSFRTGRAWLSRAQQCHSVCLSMPHLFESKEFTLAMLQFTLCRMRLSARRICGTAHSLSRSLSHCNWALHLLAIEQHPTCAKCE